VLGAVGKRGRVRALAPERETRGRALVNIASTARVREFAGNRITHAVADLGFEIGEPEHKPGCLSRRAVRRILRHRDRSLTEEQQAAKQDE